MRCLIIQNRLGLDGRSRCVAEFVALLNDLGIEPEEDDQTRHGVRTVRRMSGRVAERRATSAKPALRNAEASPG